MKKILIAILSVVLLLGVASSLVACGKKSSELGTIGILMPTQDLQRWNQDGTYLKKEFEAEGYDVDLQYAFNNVSTQINQLESMVTKGVKAVVISAINGGSLNSALEQAKAKDITVIAYDRLIMNTLDVDHYVSFDNFKVGEEQGKFIEEKLGLKNLATGTSKNIEFVAGDPGDNNATLFFDGAMSILKPYLDNGKLVCKSGQVTFAQVSTTGWNTQTAATRFETIITTYYPSGTKLDAVCASNDSTAQGIAAALTNKGVAVADFPVLTGQDCDLQSVKNMIAGKQTMSVFKDTRVLSAKAVEMTLKALNGETVETNVAANDNSYNNGKKKVNTYLCSITVVTKENYKAQLIDTYYYSEDDLK